MNSYPFVTVDVFTSQRFGGNPLAVFPDGRGLSDANMQALAREFNLSETTFVLPPSDATHSARVRIFTPALELPFAGHPNVGTGYVLAREGRDRDSALRFEEIAGLVDVTVERDATGEPKGATIQAPQPLTLGAELPPDTIAACAGLKAADVVTAMHPPIEASVGTPIIMAQVAADALARAAPDLGQFRRAQAQFPDVKGILMYLYARDAAAGRLRARMFGPLAGIVEDPATGGAAAPLAALLLSLTNDDSASYDIVQGVEMGRPSLLRTTARRASDGVRATVGGDCVLVLRGEALV